MGEPARDDDYVVVVDPELGRIALAPLSAGATAPQLNASYYYGFNADMGGGDYLRGDSFVVEAPRESCLSPTPSPWPATRR